jgi:hypothetical protein
VIGPNVLVAAQMALGPAGAEAPWPSPKLIMLVPPLTPQARPRRGLPLPELATSPVPSSATHYAVTTVDARGRLADGSPLRELRWSPGRPIEVVLVPGGLMAAAKSDGAFAVTKSGHLRLPADLRHALRLRSGDRLLVAVEADRGLLFAYTMATLDALVANYWQAVAAGRALQ